MSLHDAIRRNDVALVDELVTGAGTDVLEGLDRLGWSPLRCAVREGRVDYKAGVTALHRCCLHGNVDCVRLLLEHKANVFLRDRSGNGTALHWAAEAGAISCVMELIRAGAELNALNIYGLSPVECALRNNKYLCTEVLLDAGAKLAKGIKHSAWVVDLVVKRGNVKRAVLALIEVMRKRIVLKGMEHIGGRLPRDVVGILSRWVWSTRFDERWAVVSH